jgi:CRP-like cAMP-binding protein
MSDTDETRDLAKRSLSRTPPSDRSARPSLRQVLESNAVPFATATYAPRRAIFRQGDVSNDVIYVETGAVLLVAGTRNGKEAISGILRSGAFLGEETLIGRSIRRQSAIALIPTTVLVVAKVHLLKLLHTQPAIADRFLEHVLTRSRRLEIDLTDQLLYSTEHRLAHTLLVLAGCDPSRPCRCVLPHLSQEIIAEMVGTTRSRVNAFMGKFKKAGFIEEHGGQLYIDTSFLPAVCDDDRPVGGAAPPPVTGVHVRGRRVASGGIGRRGLSRRVILTPTSPAS